jgi:hypothetical protein
MVSCTDERGISVGERDDRDVHIRRLQYRLVIGQRVGDDQETRLEELLLDLSEMEREGHHDW